MKTLYLDIFSGISGDMFIGAMLDLGVSAHELGHELEKLALDEFHLHVARAEKASIEGVKFDVHMEGHHNHDNGDRAGEHKHAQHHGKDHDDHHPVEHEHSHGHSHSHSHEHADGMKHTHSHSHDQSHADSQDHGDDHDHVSANEHAHGRTFTEIRQLIANSVLSPWVKEKSIAVFSRIARAEGKIHGMHPEEVHFHEVGAVDSIVDIVGACICLEALGKPRVLAAYVIEGTGFVNCAHGRFPIPAPATLNILAERNIPISQCEERGELVTPTGAAILAEFVEEFGPMRNLSPEKVGFGLGSRDNKTRPNVLRAVLGSTVGSDNITLDWETDTIAVLETNLDDINSEILGHFVERAFTNGALDVFHTSIQMKKNRPGVLLTILCAESEADRFSELILRETSALGVRRTLGERRKLKREQRSIETKFGPILIKLGLLNGKVIQVAPEFDSCQAAANIFGVPIKVIYAEVPTTFHRTAP